MKRSSWKKLDKGFTLVELLVVIGIIAVLISILLPVLGSARRSAASIKCLSNLKNLHNYFLMYAGDYKNSLPVGRQDIPDNIPTGPQNKVNTYWMDAIYPYLLKTPLPTSGFTARELSAYRKSVLWCPVWESDNPQLDLTNSYTDRFKSGYGYNIYLGFKANYPNPDAMLTEKQLAMRTDPTALFGSGPGRYYKRNEISDSAGKMLVADANLWIIGMGLTNAAGDLLGQSVTPVLEHNSTPGGMNYDRYRHGKYPAVNGGRFKTTGGKTAYNVLYVDGHAATLNSAVDGYRAIRMRYP